MGGAENLRSTQVKILTYLVYGLMSILTLTTAFTLYELYVMPDKYVRLERYQCDQDSVRGQLEKLIDKVDETNRFLRDDRNK